MKNTENIEIDMVLEELYHLREENKQLKADNKVLGNELTYFKEYAADLETETQKVFRLEKQVKAVRMNNAKLTIERNKICDKLHKANQELTDIKNMGMFEFADKYCTSESLEEAGHQFARSLGVGVRMTEEEAQIVEFEDTYVPYTAEDF